MAETTLVESLTRDAQELVYDLVLGKVPVAVAWLAKVIPDDDRTDDRADWKLFLASPLVDQHGLKVAYQKAYDAIRTAPGGAALLARTSLGTFRAVGVSDQIAAEVFKIVNGNKPPISVGWRQLGRIEAAEVHIIWVSTLPAPWQQMVLKAPAEVDEPLSPQESRAMTQLAASGISPAQAGYFVWKRHEETRPKSLIPAGTVVNAQIIGVDDDADPPLVFTLPDGRQGITRKSNTEPVPTPG